MDGCRIRSLHHRYYSCLLWCRELPGGVNVFGAFCVDVGFSRRSVVGEFNLLSTSPPFNIIVLRVYPMCAKRPRHWGSLPTMTIIFNPQSFTSLLPTRPPLVSTITISVSVVTADSECYQGFYTNNLRICTVPVLNQGTDLSAGWRLCRCLRGTR